MLCYILRETPAALCSVRLMDDGFSQELLAGEDLGARRLDIQASTPESQNTLTGFQPTPTKVCCESIYWLCKTFSDMELLSILR